MYVIVKGSVNIKKRDYELGLDLVLNTLKSGECFGDVSIQSVLVNAYDIINKNIVYAESEQECHLLRFDR
jgi:signal-transduction protein with cAMP-binding, CBS, and nucleotidyltransferase domain